MLDILFDEKIAGSFHFTPGQAYEEADNEIIASALGHGEHSKARVRGGEIWFDGELIRKDGEFQHEDLAKLNTDYLLGDSESFMTDLSATREFIQSLPRLKPVRRGALGSWRKRMEKYSSQPAFRGEAFRYDSFEQFESILIDHALDWFDSPSYHEAAKLIFSKQVEQNVKSSSKLSCGMMEFLKIRRRDSQSHSCGSSAIGSTGLSRNKQKRIRLISGPCWKKQSRSRFGGDRHGLESLHMTWTQPGNEHPHPGGRSKLMRGGAGRLGVERAVVDLGVRRIQHGVRSSESEKVMDSGLRG